MADVLLPSKRHSIHLPSSPPPSSSTPQRNGNTSVEKSTMESSVPHESKSIPVTEVAPPAANGKKATQDEVDRLIAKMKYPILGIDFTRVGKPRRSTPTTQLLKVGTAEALHEVNDSSATNLISGTCCGGGCCRLGLSAAPSPSGTPGPPVNLPDNDAFRSLNLKLAPLSSRNRLTGITPLPTNRISIENLQDPTVEHVSTVYEHPPEFVTPHAPWSVFSAKIDSSRELTKDGAPKRTYHFDLDVTDYPPEVENVDFRVGGAIGVQAPNNFQTVDTIFDLLNIAPQQRDVPVLLKTEGGRWPTIWGEEKPRELVTTRRELLTWCVDIQSYPPTKDLLRVLAEYAKDEDEKTVLLYLCSKQGQAAFCELRTGSYVTLHQLLSAFPSSKPPLEILFPQCKTLMPRFYSLSNDPHLTRDEHRRIIEIAVTIHDHEERWRSGKRSGVGSGYFEYLARKMIDEGKEVRVPMFRGLMANPLAKEFAADGPMVLIGAGVGIAPFRGFVRRRLQNANCANKVWVIQGIRDSLVDELYSGEWGEHEETIKKVVESRRGTGRYVQEEVLNQADLVWQVINAIDGRIFVCGSSKGMGEGVENSLITIAMQKGRLSREEAKEFWAKKKEGMQYIAETW